MISHKYKCVFVHQRKCAGTSIIKSFDMWLKNPDWHFANNGSLSPEWQWVPHDYFSFTVVRNPWDRFISGWKYCETTKNLPLITLLENLPMIGHDYEHLTRNQRDIIFNLHGVMVVDFVMKFETLQQDYDTVCDILKKPRMRLPVTNTTDHVKPYRAYFDDPTSRRLFMEHFGRDVQTFGYKF